MSSVASTSAPGDLRRCFECNRSPPNGAKLQKCAGCSSSTALYCSKKCQKAAWPTHKILCCRADWSELDTDIVDREAQSLGYASTKLFSKSFCDFFTAHKWAINKATIAHILLKSGPSMEIARTNPRLEILVFRFRCEPLPQHRAPRSPASTFKLVEHGFYDPLECARRRLLNPEQCITTLAQCSAFHKEHLKRNDPRYVGSMPVMYVVDGVAAPTVQLFPVHRPPPENFFAGAFVQTALGDFVRLCVNSVNGHLPLRVADPRLPFHPVPGRVGRADGRWTWEPLFADWGEYVDGRVELACGPLALSDGPMSGLTPLELMDVFSRFWRVPGDYDDAGEPPVYD
ncbi:hypothetical protein VTO73DRAFT_14250 [Trametes versicolor]